jgi:long-chain acyl-CoA synthetase
VVLAEDLRPRLDDPAVKADVESEMEQLLKKVNAAVSSYEHLRLIVISQQAWAIENGFLTPTMKVKRARIEAAVADKVGDWYETGKTVVWS